LPQVMLRMTDRPDELLREVSAYYSDKLRKFGATPAGVDWKDRKGQDTRFEQLAKVTRGGRTGTLAELGCGWGAFVAWAREHGFDLSYTGYDISPNMVEAAKVLFGNAPSASFRHGTELETADYVIASGIFNVKFDFDDGAWIEYVDRTIDEMARAARTGFAFNCLTGFSDPERKEARLFYPYPGEMFDRCVRRHGRHAALLQDYGLYEFTILIWKDAA
jgi:hypothetical protein